MTEDQKSNCHAIIHTAAVASGGTNAIPIMGLGIATDIGVLLTMAISLANVFEESLLAGATISVATKEALTLLIKQLLKQ